MPLQDDIGLLTRRTTGRDGIPGDPAAIAHEGGGIEVLRRAAALFGSSANEGLATVIGLPVDVIHWAIESLTGKDIQMLRGSENLRAGMRQVGFPVGEDVPAESMGERFIKRTGQEVGASLPLLFLGLAGARAPVPLGAPTSVTRAVTRDVLRPLREMPGKATAIEAVGATGAGGAAQVAREIAPDSPTAEMFAQLAGGVGAVGVIGAGQRMTRFATPVAKRFTRAGMERATGQLLEETAGVPAKELAERVAAGQKIAEPLGVPPTTGQAAQDRGLLTLERSTSRLSPEARGQLEDVVSAQRRGVRGAMEQAQPPGDPAAVGPHIEKEVQGFRTAMQRTAESADERVRQAIAAGGRRPQQELNATVRSELIQAEKALEDQVQDLFRQIDPNAQVSVRTSTLKAQAKKMKTSVRKAERPENVPDVVNVIDEFGAEEVFDEIMALRSRITDDIRRESAQVAPNRRLIARLEQAKSAVDEAILSDTQIGTTRLLSDTDINEQLDFLAGSLRQVSETTPTGRLVGTQEEGFKRVGGFKTMFPVLKDIDASPSQIVRAIESRKGKIYEQVRKAVEDSFGAFAGGVDEVVVAQRYQEARQAFREFADMFRRGTAGRVLRGGRLGEVSTVPESATIGQFFRPGKGAAEAASDFQRVLGSSESAQQAVREAVIHDFSDFVFPPGTGKINTVKAKQWMHKHREALDAFPGIKKQVNEIMKQGDLATQVRAQVEQTISRVEASAAKFFIGADPEKGMKSALGSRNPTVALRHLVTFTKRNPDALNGLRAAAWRQGIVQAEIGTFDEQIAANFLSPNKLRKYWNTNRRAFIESGLYSREQAANAERIIQAAELVNQSTTSGLTGGSDTAQTLLASPLALLMRVVGARIGRLFGTIQSAGFGARAGKEIAEKLGARDVAGELLFRSLIDPEVGKTVLMRVTPQNQDMVIRRLRAHLANLGPVALGTREEGPRRPGPRSRLEELFPGDPLLK